MFVFLCGLFQKGRTNTRSLGDTNVTAPKLPNVLKHALCVHQVAGLSHSLYILRWKGVAGEMGRHVDKMGNQ